MHTGLDSVICRLVVGVEVVITACAEVRPDGHLPSCVGYSRRSAGCLFVLMYHKYPGLGSSPEAKLALRVCGSKCWETQHPKTQEVVFDGLCFGGCGVSALQGDPPWGRQLHANHQGRIPVCRPDRRETDPGGFLCFCVL